MILYILIFIFFIIYSIRHVKGSKVLWQSQESSAILINMIDSPMLHKLGRHVLYDDVFKRNIKRYDDWLISCRDLVHHLVDWFAHEPFHVADAVFYFFYYLKSRNMGDMKKLVGTTGWKRWASFTSHIPMIRFSSRQYGGDGAWHKDQFICSAQCKQLRETCSKSLSFVIKEHSLSGI